jgi:hypothetical protein
MLNAGVIGMIFRLKIKGFIDLNGPPSYGSPSNSTPVHHPIYPNQMQSPCLVPNNYFIPAVLPAIEPNPTFLNQPPPARAENVSSDNSLHSPDFLGLTPGFLCPDNLCLPCRLHRVRIKV